MLLYPCADTTPILNNSKSKQGSIPVYQFTRYTGLVYQQTTTIHYKSISKNGIIKTIKIVTNIIFLVIRKWDTIEVADIWPEKRTTLFLDYREGYTMGEALLKVGPPGEEFWNFSTMLPESTSTCVLCLLEKVRQLASPPITSIAIHCVGQLTKRTMGVWSQGIQEL